MNALIVREQGNAIKMENKGKHVLLKGQYTCITM